ncbi:hypothetical protein, partial [Sulfobacillus sp. hq2]|uniref:hypothetical protein n=1 Tax=Sulfobacillus sp. hq2 TaxID=2039167 RepID=UPI000D4C9D14
SSSTYSAPFEPHGKDHAPILPIFQQKCGRAEKILILANKNPHGYGDFYLAIMVEDGMAVTL